MRRKYKDKLRRPFEKPLSKSQNQLYDGIRKLCNKKSVIKMSYPELFDVFDRVKLAYQVNMLIRDKTIKIVKLRKGELNK